VKPPTLVLTQRGWYGEGSQVVRILVRFLIYSRHKRKTNSWCMNNESLEWMNRNNDDRWVPKVISASLCTDVTSCEHPILSLEQGYWWFGICCQYYHHHGANKHVLCISYLGLPVVDCHSLSGAALLSTTTLLPSTLNMWCLYPYSNDWFYTTFSPRQ
jgi:hypothetical protein